MVNVSWVPHTRFTYLTCGDCVQFMVTDLIVVWRAWVMYPRNYIVRGVLAGITFVDLCKLGVQP